MGFMDKAKQMADQAQQKIEEAQKQFNDSQAQKGSQQGDTTRYDANGRPIGDAAPPAAQTPAAPVVPADSVDSAAASGDTPAQEPPPVETVPKPTPTAEGINASPDPFKPIQ